MEELELICFKIISEVGNSRSLYINAIKEAKKGDFKRAQELMIEGEESFTLGHHAHAELIQKEADGKPTAVTLLLLHAEDQLMSAEGFKIVAEEFIDVYKTIKD